MFQVYLSPDGVGQTPGGWIRRLGRFFHQLKNSSCTGQGALQLRHDAADFIKGLWYIGSRNSRTS